MIRILITESQLNFLFEQNQQKIKVTDKCGKTKEFDYQKWYYGGGQVARSDLNCYTWDGESYVYNFSCHFKNWTSMTKQQRDTAIAGVKRTCVGSYSEQPNLLRTAAEELVEFFVDFRTWLPATLDGVSVIIDMAIPGSGVVPDVLNFLLSMYFAYEETDPKKKSDLLLCALVTGLFIFIPGPAQSSAPVIKSFIKTRKLTTEVQNALKNLLSFVDRFVLKVTSQVSEAFIEVKDNMKAESIIGMFNINPNNVNQDIKKFSDDVKNIINNLLTSPK